MKTNAADAIRFNDAGQLRLALQNADTPTCPPNYIDALRLSCKMTKRSTLLNLVDAWARAHAKDATVESNHPVTPQGDVESDKVVTF
jgi:hypothetical protein